jgi:hypothetical protein
MVDCKVDVRASKKEASPQAGLMTHMPFRLMRRDSDRQR